MSEDVDQSETNGLLFWMCSDCDYVIEGGPEDAHQHHNENGCNGHWLYEFRSTSAEKIDGYDPTGREMHTSDLGGYYLNDTSYSPADVYEAFARHSINKNLKQRRRALAQLSDSRS